MFCPECGEVIGPGPLDTRSACPRRDSDGAVKAIGRWFRARLDGLTGVHRVIGRGGERCSPIGDI